MNEKTKTAVAKTVATARRIDAEYDVMADVIRDGDTVEFLFADVLCVEYTGKTIRITNPKTGTVLAHADVTNPENCAANVYEYFKRAVRCASVFNGIERADEMTNDGRHVFGSAADGRVEFCYAAASNTLDITTPTGAYHRAFEWPATCAAVIQSEIDEFFTL